MHKSICAHVQECFHKCPRVSVCVLECTTPSSKQERRIVNSITTLSPRTEQWPDQQYFGQSDPVLNTFHSNIPHNVWFPEISPKFALCKAPARRQNKISLCKWCACYLQDIWTRQKKTEQADSGAKDKLIFRQKQVNSELMCCFFRTAGPWGWSCCLCCNGTLTGPVCIFHVGSLCYKDTIHYPLYPLTHTKIQSCYHLKQQPQGPHNMISWH